MKMAFFDMVNTPRLKTKRLLLRPFLVTDVNDVYEWCSSSNVTEFLFWYPHRDLDTTSRILMKWIRKRRNYSWCLDYQGKAIGEIEVIKDLPDGGCEIGYTLNEHFWRRGFMKEALGAILLFLFVKAGYKYVKAITDERNKGSRALLRSLDFTYLPSEKNPSYFIAKKGISVATVTYHLTWERFSLKNAEKISKFRC